MTPTNGQWSWWRNGNRIVVGWMPSAQFGEDAPICTVRDARDAQLLVGTLDSLEAEPVLAS